MCVRSSIHLQTIFFLRSIVCCAYEGHTRLKASVREVVAQVQREYRAIHHDFRHEVDDALHTFVQAFHLCLPRRFA
jgi:hypothetical protein